MKKTLLAAVLTGVMATAGTLVGAGTATAQAVPVFSVPYSPVLYVLAEGSVDALTYADWQAAGFPTPTPAPTEYGSYPWSPVIYAVSPFADLSLINALTPDEWARAGWPSPVVTPLIPGTVVAKWASSDELFAANIQSSQDIHKLTFAEWGALGYVAPVVQSQQGFYQLSWIDVPGIAFQDLSEPASVEISFDAWQLFAFPTPAKVSRIYGDSFILQNDGDITYDGPTLAGHTLTYAEWEAAGFPTPTPAT